jgi:hypothetical protein
MYVVRAIAGNIAIDGLTRPDIRIMRFLYERDVTDILSLAKALDHLTIRDVLGYVGALGLQADEIVVTKELRWPGRFAKVVLRITFSLLGRIGTPALKAAAIIDRCIA